MGVLSLHLHCLPCPIFFSTKWRIHWFKSLGPCFCSTKLVINAKVKLVSTFLFFPLWKRSGSHENTQWKQSLELGQNYLWIMPSTWIVWKLIDIRVLQQSSHLDLRVSTQPRLLLCRKIYLGDSSHFLLQINCRIPLVFHILLKHLLMFRKKASMLIYVFF